MGKLYLVLLRTLVTRARLAIFLAAGGLLDLIAYAIRVQDYAHRAADLSSVFTTVLLPLLVPITALVFATSCLGDLAGDGTLVYVWLRPVGRWKVILVALAATLSVALPLALAPALLATELGGGSPRMLGAVLAAAALATAAYSAVFIGLGLRIRQALIVGLLYVLLWEAVIAGLGKGVGTFSIRLYTLTLYSRMAGDHVAPGSLELNVLLLVLTCVITAGLALSTLLLTRQDVA